MRFVTPIREEVLSLLALCSDADKDDILAELACQMFARQPDVLSFAINGPNGLVGYLMRPDVSQPADEPANEDSRHWAEMLRRFEAPKPLLTRDEVRELFGSLEGEMEELFPDEDK